MVTRWFEIDSNIHILQVPQGERCSMVGGCKIKYFGMQFVAWLEAARSNILGCSLFDLDKPCNYSSFILGIRMLVGYWDIF
jgi:hypothetical protein